MSDSVTGDLPSDTALSKRLQQGTRWRQAKSEKNEPFRGKCLVKGCIR